MNALTLYPPAKINLSLDVTGRRDDGYHQLQMVMHTIELRDLLRLDAAEEGELSLTVDGTRLSDAEAGKNLCVRAARLLQERTGCRKGVSIFLMKKIPMEAGLGGGSSDAAATLNGLNRFWELGLSEQELAELALALGADVPFFLKGGCALAEGIGERLTSLPVWEGLPLLLAKPMAGAPTGLIYQKLDEMAPAARPDTDRVLSAVRRRDLSALSASTANVLETPAFESVPGLRQLKERLKKTDALLVLMSGSGSAVFAAFDSREKAMDQAFSLAESDPALWVWTGCTCS